MDEDLETEDTNPELAALSGNYPELAGKSASEMQQAFLPMYLGAVQSEKAAREKSATALADRYRAAKAEIEQQRFGAPTTSQQLAALSQALLAPRRMRGFAGTLANIMPAITEPADLRAAAETKREAALRQLREQYATAADASAVGTAAAKREALGKVLPLMKPRVPRIVGPAVIDGIPHQGEQDPATGEVRWTPINPAGQGTPQLTAPQRKALTQLQTYISNPDVPEAQKQVALKNFQRQFRVNPLDYLKGAM